jgi:formylmethanofuran dehydrogenase subunit E
MKEWKDLKDIQKLFERGKISRGTNCYNCNKNITEEKKNYSILCNECYDNYTDIIYQVEINKYIEEEMERRDI